MRPRLVSHCRRPGASGLGQAATHTGHDHDLVVEAFGPNGPHELAGELDVQRVNEAEILSPPPCAEH